jgi:hypothetical protein
METYTLFWRHGVKEIVQGSGPADAMNKAGYSAGAIAALDFYAEGDQRENWVWDKETRDWLKQIQNAK